VGADGAPNYPPYTSENDPTVASKEGASSSDGSPAVDDLTEEDFYKEFSEMVDPAANSSKYPIRSHQ